MSDLFDAPGAGAENDGVAGAAFEDHLFVEFPDARAAGGSGEENAEQAAIGDGAAVDHGNAAGSFAGGDLAGDAVPGEARTQLDEVVGRVAARQHIQDAFKGGAGQFGEGGGSGQGGE